MKANSRLVFYAIEAERSYQDSKWGTLKEYPHDVGAWLTILRKELREAEDEWCSKNGHKKALCEILQVASVAFACLQQHGIVNRQDL